MEVDFLGEIGLIAIYGLKSLIFDRIKKGKVSEMRGGGSNRLLVYDSYHDFVRAVRLPALELTESIRECSVGYYIDFLQDNGYPYSEARQSKLVRDFEGRFEDAIDRKVYHEILVDVTREKELSIERIIDIVLKPIELNWSDNVRPFKGFMDTYKERVKKDFPVIISSGFREITKAIEKELESIDGGKGFKPEKVLRAWREELLFSIEKTEAK